MLRSLCLRIPATFLLLAVALALPSAQSAPTDLEAYVARVMAAFDVPGLALSVVKDGQVVVAKGFGIRRKGEPARVDERTLSSFDFQDLLLKPAR